MDRRHFLKTLFVVSGAIISSDTNAFIEDVVDTTTKMSDEEFVTYMLVCVDMWINNPGYCVLITNIGE